METNQVVTFKKMTLHNSAGVTVHSMEQAGSLFTLSALFKDGNKFKCHSWRQELRDKVKRIDQQNAYTRLKQLATTCTCQRNARKCFFHNHNTILIYCNITDSLVYKLTYGREKYLADLYFHTNETGHNYLRAVNGVDVTPLAKKHSLSNVEFNKMNP